MGLVVVGHRFRVSNITKRKAELEKIVSTRTKELQDASLRDPLTGLRNRRFLSEIIETDVESFVHMKQYFLQHGQTRRDEDPTDKVIGLFVFDLDHFKDIDDKHGHEAGDRLLIKVSNLLQCSVRNDDVVARLGSNEFLVLLKGARSDYIDAFACKMKESIVKIDLVIGDDPTQSLACSCSVGYTTIPFYAKEPERIELEQAINLAELGLYYAKNHGRDMAARIVATDRLLSIHELTQMLSSLEYAIEKGWLVVQVPQLNKG